MGLRRAVKPKPLGDDLGRQGARDLTCPRATNAVGNDEKTLLGVDSHRIFVSGTHAPSIRSPGILEAKWGLGDVGHGRMGIIE
jgi:hypothetical protein